VSRRRSKWSGNLLLWGLLALLVYLVVTGVIPLPEEWRKK
jgi:hypothetical protein